MKPEKITPITPDEVSAKKIEAINPIMIKAVNELIVKNWNGSYSTFKQKDLVSLYLELAGMYNTESNREKLHTDKQLDIEELFEAHGWKVVYDRPAWNETYPTTFTFEKK